MFDIYYEFIENKEEYLELLMLILDKKKPEKIKFIIDGLSVILTPGMSIEDIKTRLNQLLIPTTYLQNIEMQDVNLHEEKGPVLGLTRKNLQSAN